jgi:uncharacterized protein (DUF4213/DUF364 family)
MGKLSNEYLSLGSRIADGLQASAVAGLYLPAPGADETFSDEFGFVFLDDGSVGPFYVSMGGILEALWQRHPEPAGCSADVRELLQGFEHAELAGRALALGAYNALSASLFRRARFEPPDRAPVSGLHGLAPGRTVGMVGYFGPLVDRLLERGCQVLVLELAPERLEQRPGLLSTEDPVDLRDCAHVLCTASTLVNDTLGGLLGVLSGHVPLELVGPSGSGLPDSLFARGVVSVGGIQFVDRPALLASLARGESWGTTGRKYQLARDDYPGIQALIRAAVS